MQNGNHKNLLFYAAIYSQLDKHVSWLAASAINNDRSGREQEIEDGLAASKALNESRLRRRRHLMSSITVRSLWIAIP